MDNEQKCPFSGKAHTGRSNQDWWPNQLNLSALHTNHPAGDPMGERVRLRRRVQVARPRRREEGHRGGDDDLAGLVAGRLRPLRRRSSSAWRGTARAPTASTTAAAARARACIRFAPLGSWPDNANLDKARRLLWPIKQKYGRKISWADLMVLTGNVALESMGFKTFGFAGGREDVWEPEHVNWGSESTWLGDERYSGDRQLANPLRRRADGPHLREPGRAERQPGSGGRGARHPRDVPPHGDERRGDGGAHRRRPHVRQDPRRGARRPHVGPEPEGGNLEEQGFGWKSSYETGKGAHAITSGLEVTWTTTPTKWSNDFFKHLFEYEWELTDESGRREAVEAEERRRRRHRSGRARPVEEDRAGDADDRPRAAVRSGLREDLAPLPREPAGVRRRVREGVVQADAPRHGADRALPRPAGSQGAAAVAGPGARGRLTS